MFTFLNARFHACRKKGTRVRESGLTVSTNKLPGETILFFCTDCDEGRKSLNMVGEGLKICDYLVFYMKESEYKEIVCFLELKGRNLEDAVRQVLSTRRRIVDLSYEEIDSKQHAHICWKACICLHGGAPRNMQSFADELVQVFGRGNIHIKHGVTHYQLLGDFLRKKTK